MVRRVHHILKEQNIGLQTFLEPIKALGFDLGLNSKFTDEDERYIDAVKDTAEAKELQQYYEMVKSKEREIVRLQKEVRLLKNKMDKTQMCLPIFSDNIEVLTQFEKIILFNRLKESISKEYPELFELLFQNEKVVYSEGLLKFFADWDKSYSKIEDILTFGLSEKGLDYYEKQVFFYRFIIEENKGKNKNMFSVNFPQRYRTYTEDNFNKLINWYHSLDRNLKVYAVKPRYTDVDEETAIMSMLRNGNGDLIGY